MNNFKNKRIKNEINGRSYIFYKNNSGYKFNQQYLEWDEKKLVLKKLFEYFDKTIFVEGELLLDRDLLESIKCLTIFLFSIQLIKTKSIK